MYVCTYLFSFFLVHLHMEQPLVELDQIVDTSVFVGSIFQGDLQRENASILVHRYQIGSY